MWQFTLLLIVFGNIQFAPLAKQIVLEECGTIDNLDEYIEFESGILEMKNSESVFHGLHSLFDFIQSRPNFINCHQRIVANIYSISSRADTHVRMRVLVQLANLFKLVGIREWYRLIIKEYDEEGVSMENRRAPFTAIYTDVSFRLH